MKFGSVHDYSIRLNRFNHQGLFQDTRSQFMYETIRPNTKKNWQWNDYIISYDLLYIQAVHNCRSGKALKSLQMSVAGFYMKTHLILFSNLRDMGIGRADQAMHCPWSINFVALSGRSVSKLVTSLVNLNHPTLSSRGMETTRDSLLGEFKLRNISRVQN